MTRPDGCICDYNPATTDGPEQDCPHHGDIRLFAHMLDKAVAERDAALAAHAHLRALCDEAPWPFRAALDGPDE